MGNLEVKNTRMKVEMYIGYLDHTWNTKVVDMDRPVNNTESEIEKAARKVLEGEYGEAVVFCGLYYIFPEEED